MHHVGIVEAAHHVHYGVHLADVGQELVAQPLALACPSYQPGNVYKFDGGVDGAMHTDQLAQLFQAHVRYRDNGAVRLNRGEGIVGHNRLLCLCQCIKKRTFAHVGQADEADVKRHLSPDFQRAATCNLAFAICRLCRILSVV